MSIGHLRFVSTSIILTALLCAIPAATALGALLNDSGQALGDCRSFALALDDLDGDGDLDLFVACYISGNRIFLNDGHGGFSDSGQSLGGVGAHGVALGDVDGDGDIDALTASNDGSNPFDRIWLNNGSGVMTDSGQDLGPADDHGLTAGLADLDGDGDLDAIVGNSGHADRIHFNMGGGIFDPTGVAVGDNASRDLRPADVDGDGDLDLYQSKSASPDRILLNDGAGNFADSGQSVGPTVGGGHARLADLDDDGDLDVFVVNTETGARVWLNDGDGVYADSDQVLGQPAMRIVLADFDKDGDIDGVTSHMATGTAIWLNDGSATFSATAESPVLTNILALAAGDADGDDDIDVCFGRLENSGGNRLHLNETLVATEIDSLGAIKRMYR